MSPQQITRKGGVRNPALPVLPLRFVGEQRPDLRFPLANLEFTQGVSYQGNDPQCGDAHD